jgi:hypothetical protein
LPGVGRAAEVAAADVEEVSGQVVAALLKVVLAVDLRPVGV